MPSKTPKQQLWCRKCDLASSQQLSPLRVLRVVGFWSGAAVFGSQHIWHFKCADLTCMLAVGLNWVWPSSGVTCSCVQGLYCFQDYYAFPAVTSRLVSVVAQSSCSCRSARVVLACSTCLGLLTFKQMPLCHRCAAVVSGTGAFVCMLPYSTPSDDPCSSHGFSQLHCVLGWFGLNYRAALSGCCGEMHRGKQCQWA